jgi:hypothetical protein
LINNDAARWWLDLRIRLHYLGTRKMTDDQWPVALKLAEQQLLSPRDAADIVHAIAAPT